MTTLPPKVRHTLLNIIPIIGLTEVAIGLITLLSIPFFARLGHAKPEGELYFVVTSSCVSFFLGAGILFRADAARAWLVYFSGWIILTKMLIFLGVLHITSEIALSISIQLKNIISFFYHGFLILFLRLPLVKKEFAR
ncbi:MAG: hypothetical protein ACM3L6_03275 [Deltaproteobacteria bacterium]